MLIFIVAKHWKGFTQIVDKAYDLIEAYEMVDFYQEEVKPGWTIGLGFPS